MVIYFIIHNIFLERNYLLVIPECKEESVSLKINLIKFYLQILLTYFGK